MTARLTAAPAPHPVAAPSLSRRHVLAGAGAALALPALGLAPARAQILGTEGGIAYRHAVGEIEVTAVLDGHLDIERGVLLNIEQDAITQALTAAYRDPGRAVPTGITVHLLRTGGRTVLVDTGAATLMGPTAGRLGAGLAAAGVAPGDIDLILLTHMHPDHIGGMVATGSAVFPNAEVRVAEAELAFWTDEAIASRAPAEAQPFFTLAREVAAAYGERLIPFAGDTELANGVTAVALPGHTPGHTGLLLASGDHTLLLWADIVLLAAVQFSHPQAGLVFDVDPVAAAATRASTLEMVAADRLLFSGAHLPFPTFGRTVSRDGAFDWQPEAWQYG